MGQIKKLQPYKCLSSIPFIHFALPFPFYPSHPKAGSPIHLEEIYIVMTVSERLCILEKWCHFRDFRDTLRVYTSII